MADPAMPTYSTGTFSKMSTDKLDDCSAAPTGTTGGFCNLRSIGVNTSNAEHNNFSHNLNVVPKAFPVGLQT